MHLHSATPVKYLLSPFNGFPVKTASVCYPSYKNEKQLRITKTTTKTERQNRQDKIMTA